MDDTSNMDLTIAGLTGVIKKMLTNPANDLYDMDAYIDEEFGCEEEFVFESHIKSTDYPTIVTAQTDETTYIPETPVSDTEESRCRNSHLDHLDPKTDPFAPRMGKTLLWRNVNMTLVGCHRSSFYMVTSFIHN
jgi:hypothetical protein